MIIVLLGPPGSGKGTQAKMIAEEFGLRHISTGDLLRDEAKKDTPLARKIKEVLEQGKLLSDQLMLEILMNSLPDDNYILDGFPRTVSQAKMLDDIADIDFVFLIDVSDNSIIERIVNRRLCSKCGRIYNLKTNPPKDDNLCDVCGLPLVQREDDKEEIVRKRLEEYHKQTEPVIKYYDKRLIRINGERPIADVFKEIASIIKEKA